MILKRSVPCSPPCSYRSRCSRFIEFKRSVRYNFNRETRENREQKKGASLIASNLTKWSVPCRFKAVRGRVQGEGSPILSRERTESSEGRRGPCSRRSRCSRFMFLKRSVCCLSNREMHENRESLYWLSGQSQPSDTLQSSRAIRVQGRLP